MLVLAAIDILEGQVVRGMAGIRNTYKPIVSKIVSNSNPMELILGLRESLGIKDFYIADLDAILFGKKNKNLYEALDKKGLRIWIDAGVKNCKDLQDLQSYNFAKLVIGLETLESLKELEKASDLYRERLVFSLDLKAGKLFTQEQELARKSPLQVLNSAILAGVQNLFILDLNKVGTNQGVATTSLVHTARLQSSGLYIIAGGGIGSFEDVRQLKIAGADAVIVSTRIHDQTFTKEILNQIAAL